MAQCGYTMKPAAEVAMKKRSSTKHDADDDGSSSDSEAPRRPRSKKRKA